MKKLVEITEPIKVGDEFFNEYFNCVIRIDRIESDNDWYFQLLKKSWFDVFMERMTGRVKEPQIKQILKAQTPLSYFESKIKTKEKKGGNTTI